MPEVVDEVPEKQTFIKDSRGRLSLQDWLKLLLSPVGEAFRLLLQNTNIKREIKISLFLR